MLNPSLDGNKHQVPFIIVYKFSKSSHYFAGGEHR